MMYEDFFHIYANELISGILARNEFTVDYDILTDRALSFETRGDANIKRIVQSVGFRKSGFFLPMPNATVSRTKGKVNLYHTFFPNKNVELSPLSKEVCSITVRYVETGREEVEGANSFLINFKVKPKSATARIFNYNHGEYSFLNHLAKLRFLQPDFESVWSNFAQGRSLDEVARSLARHDIGLI